MDKTPSGPTLSIASAIMVPINSSLPAEIVAMATSQYQIGQNAVGIYYKFKAI